MIVHLIDGTYELFRHFYGQRRFNKGKDKPYGAVIGVLQTVLQILEAGGTHIGVATDHVIESGRSTRPEKGSSRLCSPSFIRWSRRLPPWAWWYGR